MPVLSQDATSVYVSPQEDASLTSAAVSFSSMGDNTIVAGSANKEVKLYILLLVVSAATNLTIKDGASTNLSGAMPLSANEGIVLDLMGEPWYVTSEGNALVFNQSGTAQVSGTVWYQQQ